MGNLSGLGITLTQTHFLLLFFFSLPGEEEVRGKVRAHVLRLKHNLTKLYLAAGRRSPTGPEGDQ